jgi:hypothetical protein
MHSHTPPSLTPSTLITVQILDTAWDVLVLFAGLRALTGAEEDSEEPGVHCRYCRNRTFQDTYLLPFSLSQFRLGALSCH